jgi:hypothetical protein
MKILKGISGRNTVPKVREQSDSLVHLIYFVSNTVYFKNETKDNKSDVVA